MRSRRPYKRTLTLDKERKKFLGVCAGIANYLEVEPWSVRLVFLVSILFGGWFLVPLYFIAWFCLDTNAGDGVVHLAESQPLKHFRTVDYGKKLYRNTEDGKFLGICAGVADYLEVNVFAVRLVFLVLMFFAAALPLFIYFGAYFILEEKPLTRSRLAKRARRKSRQQRQRERKQNEYENEDTTSGFSQKAADDQQDTLQEEEVDEEFTPLTAKTFSKRREFKYCARKFATLQHRLTKMEAYVTSKQFRLHREFKNI